MSFNYGDGIITDIQKGVADSVYSVIKANRTPFNSYNDVTDASKINLDSNFKNDLGLDSIDLVEVWLGVEKKFGIKVNEQDIDGLNSVAKWSDYIETMARNEVS